MPHQMSKLLVKNLSLERAVPRYAASASAQLLQFCGFSLKNRKLKYGEGPAPPGWPSPLDWSSFRGPGKHSSGMCIEIIIGLKHERNKQAGTHDFNEEEEGVGQHEDLEEGEVLEDVQEVRHILKEEVLEQQIQEVGQDYHDEEVEQAGESSMQQTECQ